MNNDLNEKEKQVDLSCTSLNIYKEVVLNEYNLEIERKVALENRHGFLIAFDGAILTYILQTINLKQLFILFPPLNLYLFVRFFIVCGIFFCVIASLLYSLFGINPYNYRNFDPQKINDKDLVADEIEGTYTLIANYKNIIKNNRIKNDKKTVLLRNSIINLSVAIFLILLYFVF